MKKSAGILLYRFRNEVTEVLLVHPGGPFFARKDEGAWSIPKGEYTTEEPLVAALREFEEETSHKLNGDFLPLTPVKLSSGKMIVAFAMEGDLNVGDIVSNTFNMEWPPRSGKFRDFPEIDKGEWFTLEEAAKKIHPVQSAFILELQSKIQN